MNKIVFETVPVEKMFYTRYSVFFESPGFKHPMQNISRYLDLAVI